MSAFSAHIVPMTLEDWPEYRELRLEMVQSAPNVFNLDPGRIKSRSDQDWVDDMQECVEDKSRARFLARVVGNLAVGIVGLITENDSLLIGGLYIRPEVRNTGIASQLIRVSEEFARTRKLHTLSLWVSSANHVARSWYERLGFEPLKPPHHKEWWDGSSISEELLHKPL